eukprot:COSAG01_NODE_1125_length_11596_cov_8.205532_3_plen_436_part_00
MPKPGDGEILDGTRPTIPGAQGGGRPARRPRSAIRMLQPGEGGGGGGSGRQMGSQSDLAAQLGLNPGARSNVSTTARKMERTARTIRAPGQMDSDSDSDSSDSSDGGDGGRGGAAAARRPVRRQHVLPSSPAGGSLTGGSQFRMMKVNTATIKREDSAAHRAPSYDEVGPRGSTPSGPRPRMAVATPSRDVATPTRRSRRRGSDASSAAGSVASSRGSEARRPENSSLQISPFTAAPIAPASKGQLQGSKGLATPHELADYTKRKVAEIMARERQTLTRDVAGRSSRMSNASTDSAGSIDIDKIREKRGGKGKKEESDSSDESDQEEDADQLFMMELKKETLSRQTKCILCLGFTGLMCAFLGLFVLLTITSIQRECDNPWFHDSRKFAFAVSRTVACRFSLLPHAAAPSTTACVGVMSDGPACARGRQARCVGG